MPPPSHVDHERIKLLASQGKTRQEIADLLGATYATVSTYFWRHGMDTKFHWYETKNKIKELSCEGLNRQEIAERIGTSYRQVEWLAWKHEIPVKRANGELMPDDLRDQVTELAAEQWTEREIAERLGYSTSSVHRFMIRHDIPRQGKKKKTE